MEDLYILLDKISYFDRGESDQMLLAITEVEKFISEKRIYLDKSTEKVINKWLDYYKSVLVDFRKKNYEYEMTLVNEFRQEFSK